MGKLFPTSFFSHFAAILPDDAAGTELTVLAGVGAGPAFFQTFLTVTVFHLVATDISSTVRMKATIHRGLP